MTEDSARLPSASAVGADHVHPDHLRKEGWTMALYVAICLIAALTAPRVSELNWARYTCAGIIGVVGYLAARGAERSQIRAVLFGLGVLVVAVTIAALKHALAGH
jgi:hypothetical protein